MKHFVCVIALTIAATMSLKATVFNDSTNRRKDSLIGEIKYAIVQIYRPIIFDSIHSPNLKKLEKGAVAAFGAAGEEVIWGEIAFYHYILFNKAGDRKDLEKWIHWKEKQNTKYPKSNGALTLNNDAWFLFLNSIDPRHLKTALIWSSMAMREQPEVGNWVDTYANLLYKLGRKNEALQYQEKALQLEPENEEIKLNLKKMKAGKPTWHGPGYEEKKH